MQQLADQLAANGWATSRDLFPPHVLTQLHSAWTKEEALGRFREAGIGSGRVDQTVRGDRIAWLDPACDDERVRAYATTMTRLSQTLSRALLISLNGWEAHFATYPPGSFYQRHRDQHATSDARKLSTVLYLNDNWQPDDGGELVLYTAAGPQVILPEAGLFVCFLSSDLEHEVLPTRRERRSITGWLRHDASPLGPLGPRATQAAAFLAY